jgi:hypothetical protein
MNAHSVVAVGLVGAALLVACGDDAATGTGGAVTATTVAASAPSTATVPGSVASTTTTPLRLSQPAVWPAPDVVFATPEEAAQSFVHEVLGVPPVLGEFRQGDSRSGEIDVLSPAGGSASVLRGLLLLRQLGPDSGWFVLAAVNDNASITMPPPGSEVAAGPLRLEGRARGFEGNVTVTAFEAGNRGSQLDQIVTQGGALVTPAPFPVTLDLSAPAPGDTVALLVRGGPGSDTDPGEFGVIPVTIAG